MKITLRKSNVYISNNFAEERVLLTSIVLFQQTRHMRFGEADLRNRSGQQNSQNTSVQREHLQRVSWLESGSIMEEMVTGGGDALFWSRMVRGRGVENELLEKVNRNEIL